MTVLWRSLLVVAVFALAIEAKSYAPSTSLNIISNEYPTSVKFEVSETASIQATGAAGADEDFIYFDGETLSIAAANKDRVDEALSFAPKLGVSIVQVVAAITFVILSVMTGRNRTMFLIGLATSAFVISFPSTSAQAGPSYIVIVRAPATHIFSTLNIDMEYGSITGGGLEVGNANVTIRGTGSITLANVGVFSSASLNSIGDLSVSEVSLKGTAVSFTLTSAGSITAGFYTFRGSVEVDHSDTSVVNLLGSHCQWTQQPRHRAGTCDDGAHSVHITAGGAVTADFGAACPLDYRDAEAQDFVPSSPVIGTTIPAITYEFNNASQWLYREEWNSDGGSLTANNDGEFVVTQSADVWNSDVFWIVCGTCLPSLRSSATYDFSMDFRQHASNPSINNNNIRSMKVLVLKNMGYPGTYRLQPTLFNDTSKVLASADVSGPFNITTAPQTKTVVLQASENYYSGDWAWNREYYWDANANLNQRHAVLAVRVQLYSSNQGTPTFYFKSLKLSKRAEPWVNPTPLSRVSELITLPKMATALDANPRTNCPWNEPGLKVWHDPATWGSAVPSPSSVITLPADTKVLITSCSVSPADLFERIVIPAGSELIFSDAAIKMRIKGMVVHGKLRIGSETCRVFSEISITIVGTKTATDVMGSGMGAKGIGVSPTGVVEMHGKQYHASWTRLAATADPGVDKIVVQDPINWEVGQRVFITTSIYQDEWWNQNEIRTIKAISGQTLEFTEPLRYGHYGGIEYQSEVGLLDRKITIQGDGSEAEETTGFGGHIFIRGAGRLSGVRVYRMGQTNFIAKYPIHFHMMNDGTGSYARDCSCEHTFFRCVTVHGTHNLDIRRNTAFDVRGHCYYLEDGVEENNTFSYNLAAFVHVIGKPAAGSGQGGESFQESSELSQPADAGAAGFYVTNAHNAYIGNAASGGWAGFSFPNLFKPIGQHQSVRIDPAGRPNWIFEGNTIHSTGYEWSSGSCIYVGGWLYVTNQNLLHYESGRYERVTRLQSSSETYDNTTRRWNTGSSNVRLWMRFNNTRAALCRMGVNHWGDKIEIVNYEAHDVQRGATVFGEAWVGHAIIERKSANPFAWQSNGQGMQYYDTWVKTILTDITFRNYQKRVPATTDVHAENYCIISMTHSDKFKPQGISAARNIKYVNVDRTLYIGHKVQDTGSSRYFNFIDFDGTASATGVPTVVGSHSDWWKLDEDCTREWGVWICDKPAGREIGNLNIITDGISECAEPAHGTSIPVGNMTLWGDGVSGVRSSPVTTCAGVTGATGKGWYFWMPGGTPTQISIFTYLIPNGTFIMFAARYPGGTTFQINTDYSWGSNGDAPVTSVTSLAEVRNGDGRKYYFDGTYLYVKLVNHLAAGYFERDSARVYTIMNSYKYVISATNCGGSGTRCATVTEQTPSARF